MMEMRDFGRFLGAYITIVIIDVIMSKAFGLPINDGGANEIMAVGYTLVYAIRERV